MTHEAEFMAKHKHGTALQGVLDVCNSFFLKYRRSPDSVYINVKLQKVIEEELSHYKVQLLPIPSQDIVWFYCPPHHVDKVPGTELVMVCHTQIKGSLYSM